MHQHLRKHPGCHAGRAKDTCGGRNSCNCTSSNQPLLEHTPLLSPVATSSLPPLSPFFLSPLPLLLLVYSLFSYYSPFCASLDLVLPFLLFIIAPISPAPLSPFFCFFNIYEVTSSGPSRSFSCHPCAKGVLVPQDLSCELKTVVMQLFV